MSVPRLSSTGIILKDEGSILAAIASLNFVGGGVAATVVGTAGTVTVSGAGGTTSLAPHIGDALTGGTPGTAFAFPGTPSTGTDSVYIGDLRLRRVTSGAGLNEYTISGVNVTTGFTVESGQAVWGDWFAAGTGLTPHIGDALTGSTPGTSFAFPGTPATGMDAVFVGNLRLRRVSSGAGLNEYTISGANVTTGFTVEAGQSVWGDWYA